jgi:protein SCO1/2
MPVMLDQRSSTFTRCAAARVARVLLCLLSVAGIGLAAPAAARAQSGPNFLTGQIDTPGPPSSIKPSQLQNVTFKQHLNQMLPLDATFKDEYGRSVTLGKYFTGQKPVILAFVYFTCPMLCTQIMNGISSTARALPFTAGEDYDVVLVSFDPRDNPAAALEKKQAQLKYWQTENTSAGWHFLTGDQQSIERVTKAAGFTYEFDAQTGQFAHVSGVLVATPQGRLARYFYGVEYSPKEMRLALVDAGMGRIGSVVDEVLLYCYHYDPETGRYGAAVMNIIRLGGVVTLAAMAIFFIKMRKYDSQAPTA